MPLAKACARIMLGATIAQLREEGVLAARRATAPTSSPERPDRGEGGGAAVPPVPQGRRLAGGFAARAGDEVHRRGDGHRPRLRHAPSPRARPRPTVRCPPRARSSSRWPTGTSARWCSRSSGSPISGSGCWPPRAPRRCCAATAFRATWCASTSRSRARAGPRVSAVDAISAGEVDMVINTPYGNSGPAYRRLRDPFGRRRDEHSVRDDGAGRLGGGAGHRGGYPRRHRRAVAAGAAQPAGERPAVTGFGARLADAMAARGPLCLGIDPHPELLTLVGSARGRRRACTAFSDDLRRRPSRASPSSSRRWRSSRRTASAGFAVLEQTIAALAGRRRAGARRRQARRHRLDDGRLRRRPGRATRRWRADAVTASPYLGFESLRPLLDVAAAHDRGVFVLAATSNPEGASVQRAAADGRTVAQSIVDRRGAENAASQSRVRSVSW